MTGWIILALYVFGYILALMPVYLYIFDDIYGNQSEVDAAGICIVLFLAIVGSLFWPLILAGAPFYLLARIIADRHNRGHNNVGRMPESG